MTESTITHDTLQPPELTLEHVTLYHGSATPGIDTLAAAENDTIGSGAYFVDNPLDAKGYANRRSKIDGAGDAVVYGVEIEHVRLANLDNPEQLQEVMVGFNRYLIESLDDTKLPWFASNAIYKAVESIAKGVAPGHVRDVTFNHTVAFKDYLQGLGYDGLKSQEGGEGNDVGNHESYVLFEPSKLGKPFVFK